MPPRLNATSGFAAATVEAFNQQGEASMEGAAEDLAFGNRLIKAIRNSRQEEDMGRFRQGQQQRRKRGHGERQTAHRAERAERAGRRAKRDGRQGTGAGYAAETVTR